jgi:hypothetical protein
VRPAIYPPISEALQFILRQTGFRPAEPVTGERRSAAVEKYIYFRVSVHTTVAW